MELKISSNILNQLKSDSNHNLLPMHLPRHSKHIMEKKHVGNFIYMRIVIDDLPFVLH